MWSILSGFRHARIVSSIMTNIPKIARNIGPCSLRDQRLSLNCINALTCTCIWAIISLQSAIIVHRGPTAANKIFLYRCRNSLKFRVDFTQQIAYKQDFSFLTHFDDVF